MFLRTSVEDEGTRERRMCIKRWKIPPASRPNLYISQREIAITYFLAGVAFNNPQIKGKPRRGARETTNDTRHCHYYPCISWCIGTNGVPVGAAGTKHNVSRGRNRLGWIGRGGEGKGCPKTRATHAWLNTHTRLALRGLNISMKAVGSGKQLESIILSNCINPHSFRQRWTRELISDAHSVLIYFAMCVGKDGYSSVYFLPLWKTCLIKYIIKHDSSHIYMRTKICYILIRKNHNTCYLILLIRIVTGYLRVTCFDIHISQLI